MRVIATLLLAVLQLGVPGLELIIVLLCAVMPRLKLELLAEGLRALRELERLERRRDLLRGLCGECARDEIVGELELEIAACESSIRRDSARRATEDLNVGERLEQDVAELRELRRQRRELLEMEVSELHREFLDFLQGLVEQAESRYLTVLRAYTRCEAHDEEASSASQIRWAYRDEPGAQQIVCSQCADEPFAA